MLLVVEVLCCVLVFELQYQIVWVVSNGVEVVIQCVVDMFDVVLMDLFMLVMDGVEVICWIMVESFCVIVIVIVDIEQNVYWVFEVMGYGVFDVVNMLVLGIGNL